MRHRRINRPGRFRAKLKLAVKRSDRVADAKDLRSGSAALRTPYVFASKTLCLCPDSPLPVVLYDKRSGGL